MNALKQTKFAAFVGGLATCLFIAPHANAQTDAPEPAKPGLHLKIPAGWKSRMRQPPAGETKLPTVMQIDAREGSSAFSLKLTFLGNSPRKLSDDDVKTVATAAARQYVDKSVEKAINLQELKNDNFLGYYATFTDSAPSPAISRPSPRWWRGWGPIRRPG